MLQLQGGVPLPNKDVGYLIKSINDKLKVKADADLKRYNLTFTQSRVFAYLQEKGGQATQKEIEVFLDKRSRLPSAFTQIPRAARYIQLYTGAFELE